MWQTSCASGIALSGVLCREVSFSLVSRSPRRNIRMAADALADMAEVLERFPERRTELAAALGEDLLAAVNEARAVLERAAARLNDSGGNETMTET